MNDIPIHVLFGSGATRSFVSLALSKRISESSGMSDRPLEVEIAYDQSFWASEVYRDYLLRMYGKRYLVYLVPIPLHRNKVIIGMDRLRPNREVIDYA